MSFTSGRDRTGLAKIYDRLRKRSSRNIDQPVANMGLRTSFNMETWVDYEHRAYTKGVSDALSFVADTGSTS